MPARPASIASTYYPTPRNSASYDDIHIDVARSHSHARTLDPANGRSFDLPRQMDEAGRSYNVPRVLDRRSYEKSHGRDHSFEAAPRPSFGGTLPVNMSDDGDDSVRNVDEEQPRPSEDIIEEKKRNSRRMTGPQGGPQAWPGNKDEDPNIVGWDGPLDPENPMNWPKNKKFRVTIATSLMTLVITFASSVFSTATEVTAIKFGVSAEVMTLGTSLFVLGFAVGPLMWGPLSEVYGRKKPLFLGFFVMGIFQIPVAVAQNIQTIMLARFFGGVFGCAPLAIVGGMLADFWGPVDRGIAISVFASATFIGPVAGPIIGGFITDSYLGWRWTAYITLIMDAFFGFIGLLYVEETYAPTILGARAYRRRHETGNWALHAKFEENKMDLNEIAVKFLTRPFKMLVFEPILLLITLYMGLVYGILYLFFEAYPIAFSEQRGNNLGVGALPFLAITVGVLCGASYIGYITKTRFARKLAKHGKVVPEERLVPMIVGGFLLPAGLFWFAWTSSPNISPWPQIIAGVPIGAGVLMIFIQGLNYIIDVYLMYANSAIAANTLVRSFAGAGFPLFATGMYHNLGVDWATSLLGFLTVAMIPVPVLFFVFGKKIRALSKFSPTVKMGL